MAFATITFPTTILAFLFPFFNFAIPIQKKERK
jgi:hypothetical protein